MLARKMRSALVVVSVFILSAMAMEAQATALFSGAQTPVSKVLLMATLNNGPAMRPVKWDLYRVQNGQSTLIQSFKRHSASIELEPGVYRADVALDSVNRSRTFDVRTVSNSNVIVAMD